MFSRSCVHHTRSSLFWRQCPLLALHRLPWWISRWRICLQCRRPGFDPWVGKIPLEKGIATHSSILAWRIPWTQEPDGLQSMGCTMWLGRDTNKEKNYKSRWKRMRRTESQSFMGTKYQFGKMKSSRGWWCRWLYNNVNVFSATGLQT